MILSLLGEYNNFFYYGLLGLDFWVHINLVLELGSKIKFTIFNFLFCFCFCFCNCSNFIFFSFQDYNIDNYSLHRITPYRFKIHLVCIHQNS